MPSYRDLLKYAKTGIAAPGMSYRDMLRARAIGGGFPVSTIEGVPPISFTGDGTPLISVDVFGNARQTGTPSPQNIIMPELVGVRTAQIIDYKLSESGGIDASGNLVTSPNLYRSTAFYPVGDSGLSISFVVYSTLLKVRVNFYDESYAHISREEIDISQYVGIALTIPQGAKYFKWTLYASSGTAINEDFVRQCYIMINTGSTALPYEPYGYAIPISCAGQTVPVYLGQTQTVRRIKKRVFTGQESWSLNVETRVFYTFAIPDFLATDGITCMCSHYPAQNNAPGVGSVQNKHVCFRTSTYNQFYLKDTDFDSTDALKAYIAQQYAAGTPVCVWYVLATPETGIVNEPLCKIGDYADELHSTDAGVSIPTAKGDNTLTVDTDLPPSSVSITGHIK